MHRRFFHILTLLIVSYYLGVAADAVAQNDAGRPPNIVLIVSDDQGYNDLGILNAEIITPNLDRIAQEGVRLTNFYVAWPACTPSRGAFLTGRYPQRNGVYDMIRNEAPDYGYRYSPPEYSVTWERIGGMDTREILIPSLLKKKGYVSGIFGKWDLGSLQRYLPLQRGFDEFFGLVNTGIDFYTHQRYGVPSMFRNNTLTTKHEGEYCTYLFQKEAVQFVQRNKDRPFFLYLPFNAPHGASNLDPKIRGRTQAPEKWRKLYPQYFDAEDYVNGTRYGKPAMVPNRAMKKSHYLGCVTAMDAAIGEVLKTLDENNLTDNTLVVFFSDNGGSGSANNGLLRGRKAQLFEGGVRVLSLVKLPGKIPPNTVCDEFLTSLELLPTLLNLVGSDDPRGVKLDGFDMLPVLMGPGHSIRNEMYWKRKDEVAARIANWKWIRTSDQVYLFDLESDPGESTNLIQREPQVAVDIQRKHEIWEHDTMVLAEPRGPYKNF